MTFSGLLYCQNITQYKPLDFFFYLDKNKYLLYGLRSKERKKKIKTNMNESFLEQTWRKAKEQRERFSSVGKENA